MLNSHCVKVVLGTIAMAGRRKLCYALRKTGSWYSRLETKYVQQQCQGLK